MEIAKGKLNGVVQYCIYKISTGKWEKGRKLPSVRKAEELWNVNRLTVLSAYRVLMEMNLVISKSRSGYFVSSEDKTKNIIHDQKQLDSLFEEVKEIINDRSSFNLLATLKYLLSMAEHEASQAPDLGFVECSDYQARGHCREIEKKLGVYIAPLILNEINDLPMGIKVLLTTGFHIQEVTRLVGKRGIDVLNVPIEVDPNPFESVPKNIRSAIIFELDEPMSDGILDDVKKYSNIPMTRKVVSDIDKEIEGFLMNATDNIAYLSPRVWGRAKKKNINDSRVQPIRFRIKNSAWPHIARVAKLPLFG